MVTKTEWEWKARAIFLPQFSSLSNWLSLCEKLNSIYSPFNHSFQITLNTRFSILQITKTEWEWKASTIFLPQFSSLSLSLSLSLCEKFNSINSPFKHSFQITLNTRFSILQITKTEWEWKARAVHSTLFLFALTLILTLYLQLLWYSTHSKTFPKSS